MKNAKGSWLKIMLRRISAWAWKEEIEIADGLVLIKKLNLEPGAMRVEIEHNPEHAQWVIQCLASCLTNAKNYAEATFKYPSDEYEFITVLIKKWNGKTPHQLRVEAEAERDALKERLENCKKIVKELCDGIQYWGQQEDGIPDFLWGAYDKGRSLEGVVDKKDGGAE